MDREPDTSLGVLIFVIAFLLIVFFGLAGCANRPTYRWEPSSVPWFNSSSVTSVNGVPYKDGMPVRKEEPKCDSGG